MSQIRNKVVAITGGSSGLGEATARLLAAEGAKVLLGARREGNLKTIVDEIRAAGGEADYRLVDVTRREEVEAFVRAATETFGRIDVLVNNAGLMPLSPLSERKVDEWDRMIDVNIKGVLYGIGAALPLMQAQKDGHIINIWTPPKTSSSDEVHDSLRVVRGGGVGCAVRPGSLISMSG